MSDANSKIKRRMMGVGLVVLPIAAGVAAWHFKGVSDQNDKELERKFTYDLRAVKAIDPKLIKYHEIGKFSAQMQTPKCIATTSAGQILIGGEGIVQRFQSDGRFISSFAVNGTPQCLSMSADGTIYLGLGNHVEVIDSSGKLKAVWKSYGDRSYITSIDASGENIWVADAGRSLIYRCDVSGEIKAEMGREDKARGVPGLIVPSPHLEVSAAPGGQVWVTNPGRHQIEQYSPDGDLLAAWGKVGTTIETFIGCCNPSNFRILPDGGFVTAEKGLARVKVYKADGTFDGVVAGPSSFGDNNEGIYLAVDKAGRVLVVEPGKQDIRIFVRNEGGGA